MDSGGSTSVKADASVEYPLFSSIIISIAHVHSQAWAEFGARQPGTLSCLGRTHYFKTHHRVTGTKFLLRGICIVFIPEVKNRVGFRLVRKANDGFLERVASVEPRAEDGRSHFQGLSGLVRAVSLLSRYHRSDTAGMEIDMGRAEGRLRQPSRPIVMSIWNRGYWRLWADKIKSHLWWSR